MEYIDSIKSYFTRPAIIDAVRLDVKPGDTLLITLERGPKPHERKAMQETLTGLFPGVRILLFEGGAKVQVIPPLA